MAKRSLSQNFLTSPSVARRIASVGCREKLPVLEVGPGKGMLTRELLRLSACGDARADRAPRIIAVEKDDALADTLAEKYAAEVTSGKLKLVTGDVLEQNMADLGLHDHAFSVVANIPYNITGALIRFFLENTVQPASMTLMLQREVAREITQTKKTSILSLSVRAYGTPHYEFSVSKSCFSPAPTVDSAVISIENISREFFKNIAAARFFEVVKAGFRHPRKQVIGNLAKIASRDDLEARFAEIGLNRAARAEDLTLVQWRWLAIALLHE